MLRLNNLIFLAFVSSEKPEHLKYQKCNFYKEMLI